MKKACVVCGGEFEARSIRHRACSTECAKIVAASVCRTHYLAHRDEILARQKADRAARDWGRVKGCTICGATFSAKDGKSRYCTPKCASAGKLVRDRERRGATGPQQRPCANCGRMFLALNPTFKNCSPECIDLWKRNKDREYCLTRMPLAVLERHRERNRSIARQARAALKLVRNLQSKGLEALL